MSGPRARPRAEGSSSGRTKVGGQHGATRGARGGGTGKADRGADAGQRDADVRVRRADPASMAPRARLAELGALLARGFRRALLSRANGLAAGAGAERPCDFG